MFVLGHIVDVPALRRLLRVFWLAELADKDPVRQSVQVNVVVLRGCNYESVALDIRMLHNLNCVDKSLMCNYEDLFNEVNLGRLVVKIHVLNVPNFHLARSVTSY